jgi:ribosomal-protein-alanine N-acetyltransferase
MYRARMTVLRLTTPRLALITRTRAETLAAIEALPPQWRQEVSPAWLRVLELSGESDPWIHGFGVVSLDEGHAVGQCCFKGAPDAAGVVEISYAVEPVFQGRGFATEMAAALGKFAFEQSAVRTVRAHTLPERNASTRVLEKNHFAFVGEVIDPEDGRVFRWEKRA